MEKIKKSSVAGMFYPADPNELSDMLDSYIKETVRTADYDSRAVIVPHAGYVFSGKLAVKGFQYLDKKVKNIFIFSPAHYERVNGCVVSDYTGWETPLGEIKINQKLAKELAKLNDCNTNNFAFEKEHAVDVQIPIIQKMFPEAQIIPVIYGCENLESITNAIKHFWDDKENGFVISSDLSHFYPEKEACKIDYQTAKMIENADLRFFEAEQACGSVGICGLVNFAKKQNYSMIRVGMTTSASTTRDTSNVVGYGSWFLYEGDKSQFLKDFYSDFIHDLCKTSIHSRFTKKPQAIIENYPEVFNQEGASFVTLEIDGNLCGCIGSIIAHKPLIEDIYKNAQLAAFSDCRFHPLTEEAFEHVEICISLLSTPIKMKFSDEEDFLNQIEPFVDGIIIKDGTKQSVFLPAVWEDLPDKKEFIKCLKQKAGMEPDHFSDSFEAYKFRATKI